MKDLGTTVPEVVKRMAMDVAPDYPNVATVDTMEQLYAIAETITGSRAANDDLHAIIDSMKALLRGWLAEWDEHYEESLPDPDATRALLESLDNPKGD